MHKNFTFHTALSAASQKDDWTGHEEFIHDVVEGAYLKHHGALERVEFYLCEPPMMVLACKRLLQELNVPAGNVAYDEF